MKILELFCGTQSISKVFRENGHDCRTLDVNPIFKPDYCMNILDFKIEMLKKWMPDVIWASPDCSCFSVASIGSNWTGGLGKYIPAGPITRKAIIYVEKTISIIEELSPQLWFMENPRGILRKMPFMEKLPRYTVTYCQYGDMRMKPTDIWTNSKTWLPKPMCHNGDLCHIRAPRGSKTGTQGLKGTIERSMIPRELCLEIRTVCENEVEENNKLVGKK